MKPIAHCYPDDGHSSVEEPFLHKHQRPRLSMNSKEKWLKIIVSLVGIVVVLLSVTCVHLAMQIQQMKPIFRELVYSPAQHLASKYKNIVFTTGLGGERTTYQGPATPERNALWDDLYSFGISRIPRSSAARLVNKTLPLPGERGQYVIMLNVFHQLHCLNMIRKRLYDKTDYPPEHETMGMEHMEHCYDALRQSLMCSADITPLPWAWDEKDQKAKSVARVVHTCRDFEAVQAWAREREVEHYDRTIYVPDDLN